MPFSDALRQVPFSCGNRVRAPYSRLRGLEPDYQTLRGYRDRSDDESGVLGQGLDFGTVLETVFARKAKIASE